MQVSLVNRERTKNKPNKKAYIIFCVFKYLMKNIKDEIKKSVNRLSFLPGIQTTTDTNIGCTAIISNTNFVIIELSFNSKQNK